MLDFDLADGCHMRIRMRPRNLTEADFKALIQNRGLVHATPVKQKPVHIDGERQFRSKLEARYAAHLEMLVKTGEIRRWEYEPMSLKLSQGKRYRPDFLVVLPLGAEAKAELRAPSGVGGRNLVR